MLPVISLVVPTASDETGSAASFSRTTYFADEPASMLKRSTPADAVAVVVALLEGVLEVDGVEDVHGVRGPPALASTVAAGAVASGVGIAGAEVSRSGS